MKTIALCVNRLYFNGSYSETWIQRARIQRDLGSNEPGRVATIVPAEDEEEKVWGVAYKIASEDIPAVTDHLNYREKNGYNQKQVTFYPRETNEEPFQLMLFIGQQDNPYFLGPAPLEEMAEQIFHSQGPSGKNKEYLLNLAHALRTIAPEADDAHLFGLEKAVLKFETALNSESNES